MGMVRPILPSRRLPDAGIVAESQTAEGMPDVKLQGIPHAEKSGHGLRSLRGIWRAFTVQSADTATSGHPEGPGAAGVQVSQAVHGTSHGQAGAEQQH